MCVPHGVAQGFPDDRHGMVRWNTRVERSLEPHLRRAQGTRGDLIHRFHDARSKTCSIVLGPWPKESETFDLVAANRAAFGFPNGAQVHVRTWNRSYLQATNGGGSDVSAKGPWPRQWETFSLVLPYGEGAQLGYGSRFGLLTEQGYFMDAAGGASAVTAASRTLGPDRTFTFSFDLQAGSDTLQVLTGSAEAREDKTTSSVFSVLSAPGQGFTTARGGVVQVLFIGECRTDTQGAAVEARVMVDGKLAHPGAVVVCDDTRYSACSLLGLARRRGRLAHRGPGVASCRRRNRLRAQPNAHRARPHVTLAAGSARLARGTVRRGGT